MVFAQDILCHPPYTSNSMLSLKLLYFRLNLAMSIVISGIHEWLPCRLKSVFELHTGL